MVKETVQNVFNLNAAVRNNTSGDLGALAYTTQKYYRINGGSVQLEGVKSDVKVPGRYSFIDVGEKEKKIRYLMMKLMQQIIKFGIIILTMIKPLLTVMSV